MPVGRNRNVFTKVNVLGQRDLEACRTGGTGGSQPKRPSRYGSHADYGYGSDTRNILFIDSADGSARWLLPSDKELITFNTTIADESKPPIATVILAKPYSDNPDGVDGRLLLLDPIARHIHDVASDVNAVDGAALTSDGRIAILFESNRKYRLALFDRSSLLKISERDVNVPQLK